MSAPGLIVAAPRSGAGKTTVFNPLLAALKRRGMAVQAAKVGPDYIDPAFHWAATGRPSVNLDSWAMPPSLIEALLGEEVGSFDRSAFVIAAQLTNPQTLRAALDRAMRKRPASDRGEVNGATWFRLGEGAQAAIREDVLFLALGGGPANEEQPAPRSRGRKAQPKPGTQSLGILGRVLAHEGQSLSQHFKRIGIAGFEVPGQQNAWVDVAGIVRSIERAGGQQGGIVGQGARLFADRAGDLRDTLFEARPGKDGIDADLWIRFLPAKKSATR